MEKIKAVVCGVAWCTDDFNMGLENLESNESSVAKSNDWFLFLSLILGIIQSYIIIFGLGIDFKDDEFEYYDLGFRPGCKDNIIGCQCCWWVALNMDLRKYTWEGERGPRLIRNALIWHFI